MADRSQITHVRAAALCALLGVQKQTLSDLVSRDIAKRVGHGVYALEPTVTAYCAHLRAVASGRGGEDKLRSLTDQRTRLAAAKAEEQERKNRVANGEMVLASDVEREWSDILRVVKARMLSLPPRIGQSLGLDRRQIVQIDREIRDALTALASGESTTQNPVNAGNQGLKS